MNCNLLRWALVVSVICCACLAAAQLRQSTGSVIVPRFIRFGGVLKDSGGKPLSGTLGITFALYKDQEGGAALWLETQNVSMDASGHYSVLLGATKEEGVPMDLFTSGRAQWLGVHVQGQPEQPRVWMVSVPYALKAADADTLGGLPASAFLRAEIGSNAAAPEPFSSKSTLPIASSPCTSLTSTGTESANKVALFTAIPCQLGPSQLFQNGTNVAIGNTAPAAKLDVSGGGIFRGSLQLPPTANATASAGGNSNPLDLTASSFSSTSVSSINERFRWQVEPTGNNTSSPSGKLNLLFGAASAAPSETGLSISNGGALTVRGLNLPAVGTASSTSTAGFNSRPVDLFASAWNSSTLLSVSEHFRWQAEPSGSNSSSPSGTLNLLFGTGNNALAETGLKIASNGRLTFAPGQTFPGTGDITAVTSGTGLTGGATTGNATLSLDTAFTDSIYARLASSNAFTQSQTVTASTTDQLLFLTQNGSGSGLLVGTQGGVPVVADAFPTLNQNTIGVHAISRGSQGIGILSEAIATTGNTVGVIARGINSPFGWGVDGEGNIFGVRGFHQGTSGAGVAGFAVATSGPTSGVLGNSSSPSGFGVQGTASSTTGNTTGVFGQASSPNGTAGAFLSVAGGSILKGFSSTLSNQVLDVDATGFLTAANGVLGQTTLTTPGANAGRFLKSSGGIASTHAAVHAANGLTIGEGAWLGLDNASNTSAVLKLVLPSGSTTDFLRCDQPDGTQKCHITSTGTFVGGSDFAEALVSRGAQGEYEPGDVLVMSSDGKSVERSTDNYSQRVVGVYSTRPAVLGAEKDGYSRVEREDIPVAIIGIVPTKVTSENGAIHVGDPLVTSSVAGYAMKGTKSERMFGAVLGKALEPLETGAGMIRVLVSLR